MAEPNPLVFPGYLFTPGLLAAHGRQCLVNAGAYNQCQTVLRQAVVARQALHTVCLRLAAKTPPQGSASIGVGRGFDHGSHIFILLTGSGHDITAVADHPRSAIFVVADRV